MNTLEKVAVIFFFITHLSYSEARVVLIKAPGTSNLEFKAYLETESSVSPYSSYLLKQLRAQPRPLILKHLMEKAQREFLSLDTNKAKLHFLNIIDQAYKFDWNQDERDIIFYSFLRLAQLEREPAKRNLFLHDAVIFGIDKEVDAQIFPPPLLEEYNKIKKATQVVELKLKDIFPFHEVILVNGKKVNVNQSLNLPNGHFRITALSSSHVRWSSLLPLSKLLLEHIKTRNLSEGTCKKAKLSNSVTLPKNKPLQVLFPNFCLWFSNMPKMKNKYSFSKLEKKQSIPIIEITDPKKNKKNKKWLWWVGGGVAGLAVTSLTAILLSGKSENNPPPPHQYRAF